MVNTPAQPATTEALAIPADEKGVAMVPNNRRFAIPGDQIRRAIADLPTEQFDLVWWFAGWCRRQDLTRPELGRILKKPGGGGYYSHDSVIQLLTGGRIRRGENIEPLLEAIAALRKVEEIREQQVTSGFVETRLFQEIERRCEKARMRQRIMFLFGDSQIGKTASLLEVQRRHNHGQTIYVEVPTGGNVTHFIFALAKQFGIPTKQGAKAGLRDRVIESFDSRMLLIVDEAHRCLRPGAMGGLETFSFIRELWNRRGCGIVISLTNEGRDQFLHGPHAAQLAQLWRRRITPLQLPNVPPDDDAARFAAAYGLPEAPEADVTIRVTYTDDQGHTATKNHHDSPLRLQRHVLRTEGLGVWIAILQDAADMAQEQGKAITWGAVIKAYCQAQADSEIYQ
jgi:DNA transposition AAA+ family ATPase